MLPWTWNSRYPPASESLVLADPGPERVLRLLLPVVAAAPAPGSR